MSGAVFALRVISPISRNEYEREQYTQRPSDPRGQRHNSTDQEQQREHTETAETCWLSAIGTHLISLLDLG